MSDDRSDHLDIEHLICAYIVWNIGPGDVDRRKIPRRETATSVRLKEPSLGEASRSDVFREILHRPTVPSGHMAVRRLLRVNANGDRTGLMVVIEREREDFDRRGCQTRQCGLQHEIEKWQGTWHGVIKWGER